MTTGESSARSLARAHLSQLIDMFGTGGCLRVTVIREPDPDVEDEAEEDERPEWRGER
ncbi:hypothetical protein [Streptomyces sp. A1277]|uniref:hypothetical protein n=1 Tax=Streptomyces sp. A1277 TaxID=2563103 RepID=UPI0014477BF7|nr:hypothetical protein [Streptomyces sp. A1277]